MTKPRGYLTGYVKHITDEEFKKIINYVDKKIKSPSMKLCLRLMIFLGLGAGDVNDLKRSSFNEDFTLLTFKRKKTKKVVERRLQRFLTAELKEYWRVWQNRRCRDNYLFFPSYKNNSKNYYLGRNTITVKFAEIREALGINHVYYTTKNGLKLHRLTSHTMRHYAIYRYYIASGKDIKAVQQIIEHSKMETTARYIYSMEAEKKEQQIIEKAFDF